MEKAIYTHSTLVLLLSHLIYSHVTGLDISKAIVAVFLVGLHAYAQYLKKIELPDMTKEFANFKASITKEISETKHAVDTRMSSYEEHMSKYDAFIIKNPNTKKTPNLRF